MPRGRRPILSGKASCETLNPLRRAPESRIYFGFFWKRRFHRRGAGSNYVAQLTETTCNECVSRANPGRTAAAQVWEKQNGLVAKADKHRDQGANGQMHLYSWAWQKRAGRGADVHRKLGRANSIERLHCFSCCYRQKGSECARAECRHIVGRWAHAAANACDPRSGQLGPCSIVILGLPAAA